MFAHHKHVCCCCCCQVMAGLDMSGCVSALLLDRLDSPAAAHQLHLDNRKYPDQRQLESPTHTAMLLLLRGVRSVALTTMAGTPHTHLQLAGAVLRSMTGAAPPGGSAAAAAAGGRSTLGEAVWAARKEVLGAFELAALRDCGLVVYGLAGVVAGDGEGGKAKGASTKKQ
jgi:hypothetical protein